MDRVSASLDARQVEHGLLDVRREPEEIHDLRNPRARNANEAGEVGLVPDDAAPDEELPMMGEGEYASDAGDAPAGRRRGARGYG